MPVKSSAAASLASISTPKTKTAIPTPLMCLLADYAKRFQLRLSRLFVGRAIVWCLSKHPDHRGGDASLVFITALAAFIGNGVMVARQFVGGGYGRLVCVQRTDRVPAA